MFLGGLMYASILTIHSWFRWVVVVLAVIAVVRMFASPLDRWSGAETRAARWFTMVLDIQVLLGLLLYVWISPITRAAFHDLSASMQSPQVRFWIVEHPVGMIGAMILGHLGRARLRRGPDTRNRRAARWFLTLALLLLLASMPWPGLVYGRALLRW
jgi:hypothetical protein